MMKDGFELQMIMNTKNRCLYILYFTDSVNIATILSYY